ncbi:hypothetical protein [Enterococcus faecium]|uniref:hypothetical protein n=1 Tax=Enterococcus faecium TaxID=1352 RepID=UPI002202575E|nr:hypothetical protein [Enterococcus faecium]BDP64218.1 hypothetical protein EfmJHP80_17140 [Enterococcus faecium]
MEKQELIEKYTAEISRLRPYCPNRHLISEQLKYGLYKEILEDLKQLDEPQDEKVEAHLAEHWNEDIGNVLWWNFPVEEPPYCGTPLDERFPEHKTHFTTIDMPNEIEKSKQWVVKRADSDYITSFNQSLLNVNIDVTSSLDCASYYKFTDLKKAEAVALLVDGSVEEV